MKYRNSRKIGKDKYLVQLEITEKDLLMFEDLVWTYAPYKLYDNIDKYETLDSEFMEYMGEVTGFSPKYEKWVKEVWHELNNLWSNHDQF